MISLQARNVHQATSTWKQLHARGKFIHTGLQIATSL